MVGEKLFDPLVGRAADGVQQFQPLMITLDQPFGLKRSCQFFGQRRMRKTVGKQLEHDVSNQILPLLHRRFRRGFTGKAQGFFQLNWHDSLRS